MGNAASKAEKKKGFFSKLLKKEKKDPVTLLIIGCGECGKSTILKQIRLLHDGSFSEAEKNAVRGQLQRNAIMSMQILLRAAKKIKKSDLSKELIQKLDAVDADAALTPEVAALCSEFWKTNAAGKAFSRAAEFWIHDNADYYLDHVERFAGDAFELTDDDMVRARTRTSGFAKTDFVVDGVPYCVYDVGGQRSERKKWIHLLSSAQTLLFVVNLAGYAQTMYEDEEVLKLTEALDLFKKIVTNPTLSGASMSLVFNKTDVFEKLLHEHKLSVFFPEFKEVEEKFQNEITPEFVLAARQHIADKFTAVYQGQSVAVASARAIKCHFISARRQEDVDGLITGTIDFINEAPPVSKATLKRRKSAKKDLE